jgi:hypothetical protein
MSAKALGLTIPESRAEGSLPTGKREIRCWNSFAESRAPRGIQLTALTTNWAVKG